jgi:pyridoxine 5-phosphate synthase
MTIRLGVNIDHVATLRNARGGNYPCPIAAASIAEKAGADGITVHLREDRRHINDLDVEKLVAAINIPLNLEMAATEEMRRIALGHKPNAVCLVPENREELTTEGGLNVNKLQDYLSKYIKPFKQQGIKVSLFIEPSKIDVECAKYIGADVVEFHTGSYANNTDKTYELERLKSACLHCHKLGIEVHAGHGLTLENIADIVKLPHIQELNIGHFIISHALFHGLEQSIKMMKQACTA